MNYKYIITWLMAWILPTLNIHAQFIINQKTPAFDKTTNTYLISIPKEAFGKDFETSIMLNNDSAWSNLKIDGEEISQNHYTFKEVSANKHFALTAQKNGKDIKTYITFTFLPVLNITGVFDYDYAIGSMDIQQPDETNLENIKIKAKWRGGSTNTADKHKRNYKIKTLNDKGKSKDYALLGMREDNNWILDAGQIDLFRMRNRIATELWNDFSTKPYYAGKEPKAKTGVNGKVIEVILNNEYRGIYCLTEAMDRKELKLKKYDEDKQEIHGQLWKTSGYGYATFWDKPEKYDNESETWDTFETKYPDISDVFPTDYSLLWNAVNFVSQSDDITFSTEVAEYFDVPALIDYYIFLEVVNGIDNRGKNMYWAVFDKKQEKKLTPAIWDLDATVGQNWTDNPLHPENVAANNQLGIDVLNIYNRLIKLNVDNFNKKVEDRYNKLRQTYLDTNELINRYYDYYQMVSQSGAATREENKWSYDTDIAGNKLNFQEEYAYIAEWLKERMSFLDEKFNKTSTRIENINSSSPKKDDNTYNLLGIKVIPTKGIYIKNGKKYIK